MEFSVQWEIRGSRFWAEWKKQSAQQYTLLVLLIILFHMGCCNSKAIEIPRVYIIGWLLQIAVVLTFILIFRVFCGLAGEIH